MTAKPGKVGNPTIPTGAGAGAGSGEPATNPKEEFAAKVEAVMAKGVSRGVAVQRVAKQNPELHRAMVAEANPKNVSDVEAHASFSKE